MSDRAPLRAWIPLAAVVALALAASVSGLGNDFTYDDRSIILENARVHSLDGWWRMFGEGYWPPPRSADVYRPLTILFFAVQWMAGGGAPALFHAVSVLLYAGVCAVVLQLARVVLPRAPIAAWIAAALFAVHPVHVEAVANVVGQAELLVALFCTAAVLLYIRARERGTPGRGAVVALAALYAGACLAKEHGFVLPAILAAAELCVVRRGERWRQRLRALAPLAVVLAAVGATYLVARTTMLGGVAGGISYAFVGLSAADRLWTAVGVIPEWVRLFLWPARLSADYSPQQVMLREAFDVGALPGVALLAAAVLAIVATMRRRPAVAFGLLWIGIALAPVGNFLVPTGVLLAERTLFLASVGAMLAAVAAAGWVAEHHFGDAMPRAARLALAGAVALLLAAGIARSARRQLVWRDNATLFAQTVIDAPLSYRAHWAWGERLFDLERPAEAEREFRIAIALFDRDAALFAELGRVYRERGLCGPAAPLLERAVQLAPYDAPARADLAACLVWLGRLGEARRHGVTGLATGEHPDVFRRLVAISDSLLAAHDSVP